MEETPENGKESLHSAHGNGMNEWMNNGHITKTVYAAHKIIPNTLQ
jgi:hypothetical protein